MSKDLILFVPRSGSMLLADLIQHKHKSKMFSEHWITHPDDEDITIYYQRARFDENLEELSKFHTDWETRADRIYNTDNWVAKLIVFFAAGHASKFVDKCLDNGVNVWLPHRKTIHDQFLSQLNAGYRQHALKEYPGGFVYRKKTKISEYHTIDWPLKAIVYRLTMFTQLLSHWRHVYDRYNGHPLFKVVSFEENLKPMKLEKFGISDDIVTSYNATHNSLIPTPFNTTKFNDERIWPLCSNVLDYHQYLVDV